MGKTSEGHSPGDVAMNLMWVPICEDCGGAVAQDDDEKFRHYGPVPTEPAEAQP